ncbi:sugar-binding transcriptional regulator [Bradyrhizobium sp. 149]|uniref:sugar-binding transcriptional regulator n=1 Tax=Bradyrhizobium sp. 149 TaxID=2782624 RepID=UPI001FFB77FB|nr:sugar-binding transcriptional regulator [Bradyrhizobium sp. 149]MCK1655614.1 sugar-binding transcriptional regulator [Bradyrhizobium sp. 149]
MTDQTILRVAWLYYMENLTQADIGERLGLTRARVNRMLSEARQTGIVNIRLNSAFASCTELEHRLCRECGLEDAVVIPSPENPEQVGRLIGMAAGAYLSKFLEQKRPRIIGIGWGSTLRETIRYVTSADYPELSIVSMMGGLSRGLELNTFEIAGELAHRLHAQCSYLAAPIFVSSRRSRDTFLAQEVYQEVLNSVDRIDLALLSMGDLTPRSLLMRHGLPPDVRAEQLRAAGAVGDILAQFLDKTGQPIDHGINSRAIALPLDKLARVPTSMLIAGGLNKAPIIAAVLRGRIGKVLVTDENAAVAALKLIDKQK